MYQPAHRRFEVDDPAAMLAELVAHVPATLVTHGPDGLRASILPLLYDPGDGPFGVLRGHLARGNPQWRELADSADALAILDGPEAYVSPSWYEEKRRTGKVVPTWNYVTVQAHVSITVRHEPEWLIPHVRSLVERHEAVQAAPWSVDDAPADYIETMARAIVGLELRVTRLEAKRKLSQNRDLDDVEGVIDGLSDGDARQLEVATEMRHETARIKARSES
jgi:transcriptional regulator